MGRLYNPLNDMKEKLMRARKAMVVGLVACVCLLVNAGVASAFGTDKFKEELTKEKEAVTLMREAQQGGYGIVTTEELKGMIDAGKDVVIIDTMPYEDSYKKNHIPGAKQFLFPIPEMKEWNAQETGGIFAWKGADYPISAVQ